MLFDGLGHVCLICEKTVPENAEIVSREFYMCPKCTRFFKEYMLARMKESENNSSRTVQHHD